MSANLSTPEVQPLSVDSLFRESEQRVYRRTDKLFLILFAIQWIAGIIFALVVSPRAWAGAQSSVHAHVYAAVLLGGACCLVPMFFCWRRPGHVLTRHIVAIGQTGFSSLLIHLTGGRIETHFHVFGSLAFLACYRDWRVLITATVVVATDHFVRGIWYPMSVYGVLFASPWRVAEHALWVVFEDIILIWSCRVSRNDMFAICEKEFQNSQLMEGLETKVRERTAALEAEILERRRGEAIIRANEERYRTLVENSPQYILKIDRSYQIQFINRTAEGYDKDQVIGSSLFEYFTSTAQHELRNALSGVFQFGQSRAVEVLGAGPAGSESWYSINLAPLHTDGKITGAILLATDVTERHRAEAELIKARDEAEAGNRAKSEFLATMSHELRTPMNGVIGFTNLLIDTPLNADQKEFAQTIRSSSESLLAIINDILDISKIESGKFEFDPREMNVREAVEEVGELMLPRAEEKNLELTIRCDPAAPSVIKTDPGRFRQILLNFVGNAIKFTASGHILIEVTNDPGHTQRQLRIGVRDTGIGIPREKHALLFQKFSQVDGSSTRKFGGTGLGLAICKQLVELMGGTVGLESAPGLGSHFWFTHPAAADEPAPASEEAPPSLDGLKILIVDDIEINRRILQEQLSRWRIPHESASSGPLALDLLQRAAKANSPFQIAIVDHLMPHMDGVMLAERVKADPATAATSLILLTSGSHRADARQMLERGFAAFLCKPVVRPSLLLDTIAKVWGPLNHALLRSEAPLPPPAPEPPAVFETPHPRALLAEDNPVNQKVASLHLKKLGFEVVTVENGRLAVDAYKKEGFACIFMDLLMPDMDGLEATRTIRSLESDSHIPIIALTANAMPGDRERCLAAGMDDYLSKPLQVTELKRVVAHWTPALAKA